MHNTCQEHSFNSINLFYLRWHLARAMMVVMNSAPRWSTCIIVHVINYEKYKAQSHPARCLQVCVNTNSQQTRSQHAICKGMQLISVMRGTRYSHLVKDKCGRKHYNPLNRVLFHGWNCYNKHAYRCQAVKLVLRLLRKCSVIWPKEKLI